MTTASARFANHARTTRWSDFPDTARTMARTFLHDSIAVGVAGAAVPMSDAVLRAASGWGRTPEEALVLGRGALPLTAGNAAFVNAFQIHAQEYDAVHEAAVVHPMATVVAVLLAESERGAPVTGADFLTALSVGVDVATGLGLAATTALKFFRPATAGIFGCVAALVSLRQLDTDVGLDAFGLALAFAGGTMQAHVEGLATLPVQIAAAARGAIEAVDLARNGVPGPRGAIEGPFGYLALFEDGADLAPVLASLGVIHRVTEVSWKPFPTGRAAHGAIVATETLCAQGLRAADLDTLVYAAPPLIARLVGRPAHAAMTPAYARLCFPYLAAVVLRRGSVGLADFTEDRLRDPATLALAARVRVESDGNPDPAAFVPAIATATLHDGRRLEARISAQLGSPAYPLTPAQHLAKAQGCLAFAGLGAAHAPLAEVMARFESVPDAAAAISAVLRPPTR